MGSFYDEKPSLFSLEGGARTRGQNKVVPLESGPVNLENSGFSAGGRAGLNIPLLEMILRLGASGYFSKNKTTYPAELQEFGAPESSSEIHKRLTGADIGLDFLDGQRLGFEFETPTPKEQQFMLRYGTKF